MALSGLTELVSREPIEITAALVELACHTSACRPPTSGGTGGSSPGTDGPVSTRVLNTAKHQRGEIEIPIYGLGTELKEIPTEVAAKQAAAIVNKVPGFAHFADHPGMKEGASEADRKALVDSIVDQVADNVVEVYDRSPNPETTRQWYDAANKLSVDLAKKYNVHPDVVAAVIATLSPQNEWNNNVALAHHVLDVITAKDQSISQSDLREINRVIAQQHLGAMKAWRERVAKARATGKPDSIRKALQSEPKFPGRVLSAKTQADLTNTQLAYLVRIRGGESNIIPEMKLTGDKGYKFDGLLKNDNGSDSAMKWQSYGALAAAVSVVRDPSDRNISTQLGGAHKVRSFYNNISEPNSSQPDVTMDSHAFGVALRMPLTSSHPLIATGSGNIYGTPSNAKAGTGGVHVLLAEGYRRATARVNRRKNGPKPKLLPREMQSITWEQWRYDYPASSRGDRDKGRSPGSMSQVESIMRAADAHPDEWPPKRLNKELAGMRAWRRGGTL